MKEIIRNKISNDLYESHINWIFGELLGNDITLSLNNSSSKPEVNALVGWKQISLNLQESGSTSIPPGSHKKPSIDLKVFFDYP